MKKTPFYRRRPLLCSLLLLLVTIIVTISVVLSQLDLAQIRHRLTQELSQALQQPVGMGKLQLTYQQGLAIEVLNLGIGDKKKLDIRIPKLTGTLRLQPLLHGELLLDQVTLTEPQIRIAVSRTEKPVSRKTASSSTGKLLKKFGLSLLTVHNANLELIQAHAIHDKLPSRIENLNLVLRGWESDQSGYLVVSGALPENKGHFTIESELLPPEQLTSWRQQPWQVKAYLKKFSRELLPDNIIEHLPERIDATISLSGSPASGADININIKETRTGKQLLTTQGKWSSEKTVNKLQGLRGHLRGIPLRGDVQITQADLGTLLEGNLSAENIPLQSLLTIWKHPLADKLISGDIKTAKIQFNNIMNKNNTVSSDQEIQYQVKLSLENGRWALTDQKHLEQISLDAKLDNRMLEISNGNVRIFNQPLSFEGEVHNWKKQPLFTLEATSVIDAASLTQSLQVSLPENLILSGPLPTTLHMEGNRETIRAKLQTNLNGLHGKLEPLIVKQPKQTGNINIKAVWTPDQLMVSQATLDLADAHVEGTATFPLAKTSQPVQLQLKNINLDALRPHSPLLQRLKARGTLGLDLQRPQNGNFQGTLDLDEVGAHLIWLIGDINSVTGTATFNQLGLEFENLAARLGQSPVQVNGSLRNWQNFLLDLHVRGQNIHARDLVFANQEMIVNDLDGRLLINKGGIIFDPVQVTLENGTDATVTGYVRNFSQPDTYLEIESFKHADILEVINLFVGPPKKKPTKKLKKGKPIRIMARVAQGTLAGLKFQQAEGMIISHQGLFTLYPLQFKHKDGFCLARVEIEKGLLKISGHLEGFDASTLHSEVFRSRGLVTGKLRGNFYLEGYGTGDTFWASARGGAHVEIRDGALRKYRGLAQVFSVLNVSQLFELNLPDMDEEGMPFTRLTTSTKLDGGILSTDNLHIESHAMNMSLIGSRDLLGETINATVGVKPLRTVDKIITAIPVAGWLLAGEEKALITAHFKIKGPANDPEVTAIPASSLSKTVLGLLKRTLGLPGTLITDPEKLFFPGMDTPPPKAVPNNHQ